MRLRSLEIQGFKSFPDKTRLEFGEGITAVVGPNGSGKSNIADAVRWVLGEQSTRTLRGNRMDDVIFGGTQARKPVGYASVALTIDNSDGALPGAEAEITISRRLYRSGESEYRIGPNLVRLRDIHELFMDTGLGRDGYSIIGQGRIAEIVSAKSGERREIFEEAAGISKFRFRRAEAQRKLEQAQENLLRLADILSELEGRVEPLRRQSEKAAEFLKLSEERKSLEVSLWMLSLGELKKQLEEQENKIFICKNDYELLENEGGEIEEKLAGIFREMQYASALAEEKRAEIRRLEEEAAKADSQIAVWQNDIRHNDMTLERLVAELENFDLTGREAAESLQDREAERAGAAAELARMQSRMEASRQNLTEQRAQVERLDAELLRIAARKQSLESAAGELRLEQAASSSLMMESLSRLEALRAGAAGHEAAVREAAEALEECKVQIAEAAEKSAGLENAVQGYELKKDSREKRLAEIRRQNAAMLEQAGQKRSRAKLLEDLEANMEGYPGSVRHILAQSRKGALPGVFGAVSSLISAREEHITAIETALGPAMQNIVVDGEGTAKRAMRMLQSANAGRATFLPLTSFSGRAMDAAGLQKYPAFVGVASELVQCDEKFRGVLARLLGRVCVAEELDSATQIARDTNYSFRVVTLDGQVINAGGSFTGGSVAKTAGVLGRRNEIERLGAEAAELERKAAELEPAIRAAAQELSALEASLAGTRGELQSAREEQVRLNLSQNQLQKNLAAAREGSELAKKELETLAERLRSIEQGEADSAKMLEELNTQLAGVEQEQASAAARRQALAVGVESAVQALSEMGMAELAAQKDLQTMDAELLRLRDAAEHAGERAEHLRREHEAVQGHSGDIARQIAEMQENKTGLSGKAEAARTEIAALLERRTSLEAETTALRASERELSAKREGVSRELARLEERRAAMRQEYDGIIAGLWDNYELTRTQAKELARPLEDRQAAQRRLTELRGKIRALGSVNVEAIEEYREVSERYQFLSTQVKDVTEARERLLGMIAELTGEMRTMFEESFRKIAAQFSRIFAQLFGGGRGELSLGEGEDVLEAGIDINVQPPGKAVKTLSLLSGGEQALVAIAIYFAILKVRPAPFCLLDEIEAALDDVNVVRFANYLRQMCAGTQFIAITHRRGTMEEADMLYGVTMQEEGVSKLLELRVNEVETALGKIG